MNELTTAAIDLLKDLIATPLFRKRKKKRLTEMVVVDKYSIPFSDRQQHLGTKQNF